MSEKINIIYKQAQGSDGLITTKEIESLGIGRYNINDYVAEGLLVRESKGIYSVTKEMPDEYAALQKRSQKAVYSYGTALFFHGLSDRVPRTIDMTLPQGYNASRLKKANPDLRIHYVQPDVLYIGAEELKTPQGSTVKAYNRERCICDLIKHQKKVDKQIFTQAVKTYFSEPYDPRDIIKMARVIGVEDEVRKYMEVL
jgi:predicted transcriptional regulator of viral defense system